VRVTFDWDVSPYFGWGVYGLNLALEWSLAGDIEPATSGSVTLDGVDPLRKQLLRGFAQRSLRGTPADLLLKNIGNDGIGLNPPGGVGVIFFELPLSPDAIARLKSFDLVIAGSQWNADLLRVHGVNTAVVLQGIDPALHHLAVRRRKLFPGKFVIFSGGKAEPRKGQDIVVKAFRAFARRHAEAILVTAWHSPWPKLAAEMDLGLSDIADRVVDVGRLPNAAMPAVYRECDLAVFPNRAEGGTNLVAMEAMACGVPALLSKGTGHLDLLADNLGYPLEAHAHPDPVLAAIGWVETPVEALLEAMELAVRCAYGHRATNVAELTWSRTARELAGAVAPFVQRKGAAA
jgi:glycosyltransferase involved in cell wall biosynthesis